MRQALEKADEVLKLTETARGLLSDDEAVRKAAAVKYTRLTDYVMDRIMESGDPSLRDVCIDLNYHFHKMYILVLY